MFIGNPPARGLERPIFSRAPANWTAAQGAVNPFHSLNVMAGLKREARLRAYVPAIHVLRSKRKRRMTGTRPGMTRKEQGGSGSYPAAKGRKTPLKIACLAPIVALR
jgi:hypothetical protein